MLANRRDSSSQNGSAPGYAQHLAGSGADLEYTIGQFANAARDHDAIESDYWHGDKGQFSNPFLCRS